MCRICSRYLGYEGGGFSCSILDDGRTRTMGNPRFVRLFGLEPSKISFFLETEALNQDYLTPLAGNSA